MNWIYSIVLLLIALLVIYKKLLVPLQEARKIKKFIRTNRIVENDHNFTKKVITQINKKSSLMCLIEDGKFYGPSFKNGEQPQLPHDQNCNCSYQITSPTHFRLFKDKNKKPKYNTDLGELDFYQYKYYKYSLLLEKDFDESHKQEYLFFQSNLQVDQSFKDKVGQFIKN